MLVRRKEFVAGLHICSSAHMKAIPKSQLHTTTLYTLFRTAPGSLPGALVPRWTRGPRCASPLSLFCRVSESAYHTETE